MERSDTDGSAAVAVETSVAPERERTRKRLEERRDFGSHAIAYAVINGLLILAWLFTGAGYFWPAWVLAAWGAGLVLHGWETFLRRPVTEADIDAALRRQGSTGAPRD